MDEAYPSAGLLVPEDLKTPPPVETSLGESEPSVLQGVAEPIQKTEQADPKALAPFGEVKIEEQGVKSENRFHTSGTQEKPSDATQQAVALNRKADNTQPGDGKGTTVGGVPVKPAEGAQPVAQSSVVAVDKPLPATKSNSEHQPLNTGSQIKAVQTGDVNQPGKATDAKLADARVAPFATAQSPQETGRLINGQEVKAQHPVFGPTSAVYDKPQERSSQLGQHSPLSDGDLMQKGLMASAGVFPARETPQSAQAVATRPTPVEPGSLKGDKPAVPELPGRVASIRPDELGKLPGDQLKPSRPDPGMRLPDLRADVKPLDSRLGETKLPADKTMSGRLPEGGRSGIPIGNTALPWRSVGDKLDDIVKRMEKGGRKTEAGRANKDWEPGSRRSDVNAPWGGRSPIVGPKDGASKGPRDGRSGGADARGDRSPKLEGEKPGRTIGVDGPKLRGIPVGADLKVRIEDRRHSKAESTKSEIPTPQAKNNRPYVSGESPTRQYTLKIDNSKAADTDRNTPRPSKTEVPITQPQTGVESIKNFIGRMKDHVEHALAPWKSESGRAVDSRLLSGVSRPVESLGTARQSADNKNEYVLPNSKDRLPIEHKEMNAAVLIAVLIAAGDKGRQVVREVSNRKLTDTTSGEKTQFATKPETSGDTTLIKCGHKPFIRLHLPDGTYGGDKISKGHRVAEIKSDPVQESETVPLKPITAKQDEFVIERGDTHVSSQHPEPPVKPHQESERRYVNPAMDALEQTWSSEDDEPAENGSLTGEPLNSAAQNDEFQSGLNRYRFRVGPNESVESIALTVLKDPALAPLLYKKVRQHVLPEKEYGIHPLPEGIVIDLPTPTEIAEYRRISR